MSEFHVEAVRLNKFGKHPNADSLSIISVHGRPVIFKTADFEPGSMAIHIPPDAIVDTTKPEFAWLAKDGATEHRVKFVRLRGIPSYGFLIPAPEGAIEGQNFQDALGIRKYERPVDGGLAGRQAPGGGAHLPYYDIESLHKHKALLAGVEVSVTEKIHGQQGKWTVIDGVVYASSRNHYREDSVWNRMAEKYQLARLPEGIALYGEVYGPGCQDLTYGTSEVRVAFFDAYDIKKGLWLNVAAFTELCASLDLPTAPELYRGPFDAVNLYELAEGASILCADNIAESGQKGGLVYHVREGIVVKPLEERYDHAVGRVFLKLIGEGYLARKGG